MEITVLSLTQLLKGSAKLRDKVAGNGDTKFLKGGTFWKISWKKLWHACASSPNKLRLELHPTFLTNRWNKHPCSGFIILPKIEFVCLFALRIVWLISGLRIERSLGMHRTAMTTGWYSRLVQGWYSLDCSQYSIPPYKWLCSQALLSPNSRNESRLCDVLSEQFVGVLNDQYFNKQATLASTQASRTCTAHNCLQPDWLYLNASQYTVSKCV